MKFQMNQLYMYNVHCFACLWIHTIQVGLHLLSVLGVVTAASFRVYWRQPHTLSQATLAVHQPRHQAPTLRFFTLYSHYWPIVLSHMSAELSWKRYYCVIKYIYMYMYRIFGYFRHYFIFVCQNTNEIRNTKCKRMRIHIINVYGKGSPHTKITF